MIAPTTPPRVRSTLAAVCAIFAVAVASPPAHAQGSLGLGSACQVATDCGSRNCVYGMCCDSACASSCQSCLASLTGSTNGACRPVLAGNADPQGLCGTPTCSGTTVSGGACNGSGSCQTASLSCEPFACSPQGTGCNQVCSIDSDCAPGATCEGVTCTGADGGIGSGPRSYDGPSVWGCAIGGRGGTGGALVTAAALVACARRRRRAG